MFRADLFADDLADTNLDQLAEVMADGHLADQSALIAAELRRRGF
jgi:hypothetical protein